MENKEKTEELLCEVYRNLKMGSESLCTVTPKINDKFMLREVTGQLEKYAELTNKCERIMRDGGITPKEPSPVKRVMAKGGILANMVADSGEAHVAQMIVDGTGMGADQLERIMYECRREGCSEEAVSICRDVIAFERRAAGEMTDYTVS